MACRSVVVHPARQGKPDFECRCEARHTAGGAVRFRFPPAPLAARGDQAMELGEHISALAQSCGMHSVTALGASHALDALGASLTWIFAFIGLLALLVLQALVLRGAVSWPAMPARALARAARAVAEGAVDGMALLGAAHDPQARCRCALNGRGRLALQWHDEV